MFAVHSDFHPLSECQHCLPSSPLFGQGKASQSPFVFLIRPSWVSVQQSFSLTVYNQPGNLPKELENFLWDMEQFFRAAQVADEEKVSITGMYLMGDAKLWWKTRLEGDVEQGKPHISTWETLKRELKEQFLPTNVAWLARESLRRLKHMGTVWDYVKEFSSLMLDIKNMS